MPLECTERGVKSTKNNSDSLSFKTREVVFDQATSFVLITTLGVKLSNHNSINKQVKVLSSNCSENSAKLIVCPKGVNVCPETPDFQAAGLELQGTSLKVQRSSS